MSASETVRARGTSAKSDPVAAFAEALNAAAGELARAGCGPGDMRVLTLSGPEPAALSLARRPIDRTYRETFGGTRPPVKVAAGAAVTVEIEAARPAAPDPAPVWQGLSRAELMREYSPRGQVPSMRALFDKWTADGLAWRRSHTATDLFYGPSADETFDLYRPAGSGRPPVWIFIHGGYWQASGKEQHGQFMQGMLDAGYAVANVDYGLAPETPLERIVAQIYACVDFIARSGESLGIDSSALHVSGHSAGGHLAAMVASRADGPPVRSALLLSGLFDLAPFAHLPMGKIVGLKGAADIATLSPLGRKCRAARVGVALGALESAQFKWQSDEIARAWSAGSPLHLEGANHFSLLDGLNGGPLLELAKATAR